MKRISHSYTKRHFRTSLSLPALLLLVAGLALTGCGLLDDNKGGDKPTLPSATTDVIEIVPFFIADATGKAPTDPGTPLFEIRAGQPITAPDGQPITLAEFSTVKGAIEVDCVSGGTQVRLSLTGLIPNGQYTMWNVPFNAPGPVLEAPNFNMSGRGVVGYPDGSQSRFVASAAGTAPFVATTPGGDLSEFGQIADCALSDEVEWHVIGAYHIDGQTHGPDLGPDGSAVEQFGFIFRGEDFQ